MTVDVGPRPSLPGNDPTQDDLFPVDDEPALDDGLGRTLFAGGALAIVAVAFLPSAWMRDPSDLGPGE